MFKSSVEISEKIKNLNIKKIKSRSDYRKLKKRISDLPSEKEIIKFFGNFSKFKEIVSFIDIVNEANGYKDEVKLQKNQQEKEENINSIVNFIVNNNIKFNSRSEYRKIQKSYNLPSSFEIEKIFGSFSEFKRFIKKNRATEEGDLAKVKKMRDELFLKNEKYQLNKRCNWRNNIFCSQSIDIKEEFDKKLNLVFSKYFRKDL